MRGYLESLIREQINRANVLKNLVDFTTLEPAELFALFERCNAQIDIQIERLKDLNALLLETYDDETLRIIHRGFKDSVRRIEWIEQYGIAVLKMHSPDRGFTNKLVSRIQKESKMPISIASVASFSNRYFFFAPLTNVIFVPAAEHKFLLHWSDLYHELGHYVSKKKEELKLRNTAFAYANCTELITGYYKPIIEERLYGTKPKGHLQIALNIHAQWQDSWFEEVFCDGFAVFLLGPAYVWSHIHLVTKTNDDVFFFNNNQFIEHPSDEARFRFMCYCLDLLGYKDEINELYSVWNKLIFVKTSKGSEEYYNAFPDELLKNLSKKILNGLQSDNFVIASKQNLNMISDSTIIKLLNSAWKEFWKAPETFFEYEEKKIKELEKIL